MSTPDPAAEPTGRHLLGPHCVGVRVVVRRLLRGETGPSGGPAMTDLLGVMEAWGDGVTSVRPEGGDPVTIPLADIVSGKPVPPRPSTRLRTTVAEAERHGLACWPPVDSAPLGDWLLRASGGFSSRANSVLAVGDPGTTYAEALARATEFYTARGLPTELQVTVDSDEHRALTPLTVPARPDDDDTLFQLAGLARTLRAARSELPEHSPEVRLGARLTDTWLVTDARAARYGDHARAVLEGPDQVAFVELPDGDGATAARGRVAVDGDWAGVTDVWVSPDRRGRRLASVVLTELLDWAAERGATTVFLQVEGHNAAAVAAYARLGFVTHHARRYLLVP